MSVDRCCGSTFRGTGSAFRSCAKRPHAIGLHVAINDEGSFWWKGSVGATPVEATSPEVAAELAALCRRAVTDAPPATLPDTADPRVRAQMRQVSIESGFTGDACGECGAMKLTRNGSCMKCHGCGATTGCS